MEVNKEEAVVKEGGMTAVEMMKVEVKMEDLISLSLVAPLNSRLRHRLSVEQMWP